MSVGGVLKTMSLIFSSLGSWSTVAIEHMHMDIHTKLKCVCAHGRVGVHVSVM